MTMKSNFRKIWYYSKSFQDFIRQSFDTTQLIKKHKFAICHHDCHMLVVKEYISKIVLIIFYY